MGEGVWLQGGPGEGLSPGRNQAAAIQRPSLTSVVRRAQKPAPCGGGGKGSGSPSTLEAPLLSSHFLPVSQVRRQRLQAQTVPWARQRLLGPAVPPARPGRCQGASAPGNRRNQTACVPVALEMRGGPPACLRARPQRPLGPPHPPARHGSGHQTGRLWGRLHGLRPGPGWKERSHGSCGHSPKARASTPPARRRCAEPPRESVPPELGRSVLSEQSPWAPVQTQVWEAGPQAAEAKCTGECPPGQISRAHAPEDTKPANWQRVGPGQGTPSAPVQLALILP